MLRKLTKRPEWRFFGVLFAASGSLATTWWVALFLRGVLPAGFAVAMGWLVGAVQNGQLLQLPVAVAGGIFALLQILPPLHRGISTNLGHKTANWIFDQLTRACVKPSGIGHLEDPQFVNDLSMSRDFELGMTGPPLSICMDFIASGLVEMIGGLAAALVLLAYAWWAPLVLLAAWFGTHWLLREAAVWRDRNTDEVKAAQRHADYSYRLAVEPPAAKELRLFGLADWTVERFAKHRRHLLELQWQATRLREQPVVWSLLLTLTANLIVFGMLARDGASGTLPLNAIVTYFSAAAATSMIAFGGLSWALDSAAAPAGSVLKLRDALQTAGNLVSGKRSAASLPASTITFKNVHFKYPTGGGQVLDGFNLTIPAGSSIAIVGVNGAGKTTLAKLLCRLYDPQEGSIEIDGVDLRDLEIDEWRSRLTAVFQDFVRYELPLRANVAPRGATDGVIEAALKEAGAGSLASLDTILAKGYEGGTDLSGGQWQRVALARALCAVGQGAGVVLLDEPTAQLDVRGEAEIFERILKATRKATTILISHRFSTVRLADRICVIENGKLVELGSHDELMASGGRYKTMFDLQASRFASGEREEDEVSLDA